MARRGRTERFTLEEVVPSPPATVAEQAVAVLGQLGKLLDAPDEGANTVIRATFGVGW
jgi:hypothetical protein